MALVRIDLVRIDVDQGRCAEELQDGCFSQ